MAEHLSDPMFYCEQLAAVGESISLEGSEARHAAASRRLKIGDDIHLFDGRGTVARATIENIDRRGKTIAAKIEQSNIVSAPATAIELACALPKGERLAVLLDMATQLGMSAFRPLQCEHSVTKPGSMAHARWQRICAEACKQSRRPYLPVIYPLATPEQVLASSGGCNVWVAEATGTNMTNVKRDQQYDRLLLMVGPEGGFSKRELATLLEAGAQMVKLSESILRIETAAVALMTYAANER